MNKIEIYKNLLTHVSLNTYFFILSSVKDEDDNMILKRKSTTGEIR